MDRKHDDLDLDLDIDLEALEISDFLDETSLSNAEELANVMAASCTTCECCCSVSTAVACDRPVTADTTLGKRNFFTGSLRAQLDAQGQRTRNELSGIEAEWPRLIAQIRAHQERGTDPKDPEVQQLAKRWDELVHKFTGGSVRIATAAARLYANADNHVEGIFGEERVPDPDLALYVQRARC